MVREHASSFESFAFHQSELARDTLLDLPWTAEQQARYLAMSEESIAAQKAIEAADTLPFEEWREQYMAVEGWADCQGADPCRCWIAIEM